MENTKILLKFDAVCEQDQYSIKRISGTIGLDSFIKLVDIADMDANPRKPKVGPVTRDIQSSLEDDPSLFQFKTKGILLSCHSCKPLERKRYQLEFTDSDIEGILDGGHNTLAISLFILKQVTDNDRSIQGIKGWDELKKEWDTHHDEILEFAKESKYLIPIEILSSNGQDFDEFASEILEISEARNNNAELSQETKDNKAGYYDRLRQYIDEDIREQIEWKANDGGVIKVRDIVALSLIPISLISEKITEKNKVKINPVQIFSSKGACVKDFGSVFKEASEEIEGKGSIRKLSNDILDSALKMMKDIPYLYDLIDLNFGDAYNDGSPGYGRIKQIKIYEEGKYNPGDKNETYLKTPPKTKFYKLKGKYKNPEGYFVPIVVALRSLMKVDKDGMVNWAVDDPRKFVEDNLPILMNSYRPLMAMVKYDPAQLGKSGASYQIAENAFKLIRADL